MIKKFNDYNISENSKNEDILKKYHLEWIDKYPELRLFKLEAGDINKKVIWFYSLNKTNLKGYDIDIFLEIRKGKTWSIDFELNKISNTDISSSQEKHFSQGSLDYSSLKMQLTKLFTFIKEWNVDVYEKEEFYPLIDNKNYNEKNN